LGSATVPVALPRVSRGRLTARPPHL